MRCPRVIHRSWTVCRCHPEATVTLVCCGIASLPHHLTDHLPCWAKWAVGVAVAVASIVARGLMPRDAAVAEIRTAGEWAGEPASVPACLEKCPEKCPEKIERPPELTSRQTEKVSEPNDTSVSPVPLAEQVILPIIVAAFLNGPAMAEPKPKKRKRK